MAPGTCASQRSSCRSSRPCRARVVRRVSSDSLGASRSLTSARVAPGRGRAARGDEGAAALDPLAQRGAGALAERGAPHVGHDDDVVLGRSADGDAVGRHLVSGSAQRLLEEEPVCAERRGATPVAGNETDASATSGAGPGWCRGRCRRRRERYDRRGDAVEARATDLVGEVSRRPAAGRRGCRRASCGRRW
jgi:hypothetical protein